MDDALLNEFINESREHLSTIEAELLAIEEQGEQVDKELVNKVFRAAHSIKGGSAFFGLAKVKELAHKAETVLDMLRAGKMAPNAEITNVLLAAFDRLREMINNPAASEQTEIADLVMSLVGLASSYLPQAQKASLTHEVYLQPEGGGTGTTMAEVDYERVRQSQQYVYGVDYDLIHDIERKGKTVLDLFRELWEIGEIVDCSLDFAAVGTLDDVPGNRLPLRLVFATVIRPDQVTPSFHVSIDKVKVLFDPVKAAAAASSRPATPPVAPAPEVAVETKAPAPARPAAIPAAPPTAPVVPAPAAPMPPPELQPAAQAKHPAAPAAPSSQVEETIRVNVGILENLMNLAGELVLSRNQLRSAISNADMSSIGSAGQRINQVTAELQDVIMQTRLQPIGNVFGKFPRVVRDLAGMLMKDVQVEIQGKDVALDKSLIEGLSDPLTHMVRNAVDHGIELPADRLAAGKKAVGTVRIEARHEAGHVVVEIADDGKGIDPEKIAQSALSKGLITSEKLSGMSSRERTALIFLPGLTTAEKVSDVSGRGVGMDVVKTNLDRLGGKVEILSEPGKGTTFRIKLPLTLAIIPSLIVSVQDERFAIPQINVQELLRVLPEGAKTRVEVVGETEVLVLRDSIIPLVRFADVIGLQRMYTDPKTGVKRPDRRARLADRRSPRHPVDPVLTTAKASGENPASEPYPRDKGDRRRARGGALEVAVVTTGTQTFGLVVEAFHGTEEIVVKPLGRHLKGVGEYAGATILGDGAVALILDVAGLAAKADLSLVGGTARAHAQIESADRDRLSDTHSLLLFHNAPDEPCAVPLGLIQRIERVRWEQVQSLGGRRAMQYAGGSLPLITLGDAAAVRSLESDQELAVMVCPTRGGEVGLLGAMPVDVIETQASVDEKTHRQVGIAGSLIVHDRTTLMVDLLELVGATMPGLVSPPPLPVEYAPAIPADTAAPDPAPSLERECVLLAEDSDFFRGQVRRCIEDAGYSVYAGADGEAAWELLLEHLSEVRAVVTDIEMPRLTGLELTKRIRADQRTASLPIIALTSLAADEDMNRGRAVGVDDYQIKLDREQLIEKLNQFVRGGVPVS